MRSWLAPLVKIRGGIPAGVSRWVDETVVSFGRIHKPLVRNGTLDGKYLIHVAVGEVRFDDRTTWALSSWGPSKKVPGR